MPKYGMTIGSIITVNFPGPDSGIRSVTNIDQLRRVLSIDIHHGDNIIVDGSVTSGDGKGGLFVFDSKSLDADDGASTIKPLDLGSASAGRWKAVGAAGGTGGTGADGEDGESAYEIAVADGFTGTEDEWLASLKGADGSAGPAGAAGAAGPAGAAGAAGQSAYQIAVANGFVGTEALWLASLKGADGADGSTTTGETAIASVVDVTQFAGQLAGGKGIYLIVPVDSGDPGVTLTQSASVTIPTGSTNGGIGIWVNTTTSGLALTVGLTNIPLPQPGGSGETIDLSGASTFYAPFNTFTPLGIDVNGSTANFTLTRAFTDAQLKIVRQHNAASSEPATVQWATGSAGSPYPVSGDGVGSAMTLSKSGSGTTGYTNGHLVLNKDSYLTTAALGLAFTTTSDDTTTETPPSLRLIFKGTVPSGNDKNVYIGCLQEYSTGQANHRLMYDNQTIMFDYWRPNGAYGTIFSDALTDLSGASHLIETEWVDDPTGSGGTITFFVDGEQYGDSKPLDGKVRVPPLADFEVNATTGNTTDSIDGLEVEYVGFDFGRPTVATTYTDVVDGPIAVDDLQNLAVDANGVTTQQPEYVLKYTTDTGDEFDMTIVVGEMVLPAGRPYKVVLEDWSSGAGVTVGELVMTNPAAQNCRFEDSTLYGSQGSWTEVVPQDTTPLVLDGIRFGCEGIRQGTYTQFQFIYSQDTAASPFGDPTGLETYMRAHKWLVYDNTGTLLQRIEKPNGEPLNASSTKPIWEGTYDGRSVPQITSSNKWYPHGTVRCSIIYRNGKPPAYDQQFIYDNVPVYDQRVQFASHTGYSVNGFDLRIAAGGAGPDGQMNGFATWKLMPYSWGAYDYESIKAYAAGTQDPYKNLYNDISATPNAALWMEYTPFNVMGRSPVVGPGGTRDDRQVMPEVVARYARDVTATRPHDGKPLADLALDYLTGYASDAFNSVVGSTGKLTPLYKGNPRRNIRMRNSYYGYGEATTPDDQAWYAQLGRLSEWTTSTNPLRSKVPTSGNTADHPFFGGFEIDASHAHQFPAWGSLMFQTPEFAMLQVNFADQVRMYQNDILGTYAGSFAVREQAWKYGHAALLWKTASANSTRLYSRQDIMDWVVYDFELFYDSCYASTPGFMNPPTNVMQDGAVNGDQAIMASASKYGLCYFDASAGGVALSEFQAGYWLSVLHVGHKLGFNDALRAQSAKCAAVLDWMLAMHRTHIVGRVNTALDKNMSGSDYQVSYWTNDDIVAANGDVSQMPQSISASADKYGRAATWDVYTIDGVTYPRDGQAMDALLAGPAILKDMGMSGADLDQAIETAEARFQEKLASEAALGVDLAGSTWFKYHQTTNNRPYVPA